MLTLERLYSIPAIARETGISEKTLRTWRREKKLVPKCYTGIKRSIPLFTRESIERAQRESCNS